jgi:hypothetical protein
VVPSCQKDKARLGYARDAVNSYFVFRVMKEKGVLPPHIRFQVSIPMVNSVLPPRIFPNVSDLDKIRPGYEAAIDGEVVILPWRSRLSFRGAAVAASPESITPIRSPPSRGHGLVRFPGQRNREAL